MAKPRLNDHDPHYAEEELIPGKGLRIGAAIDGGSQSFISLASRSDQ